MIQRTPAYLRMLRGTKPVQTAVKGCQKEDRELRACLNSAGRDTFGGANNCFDILYCEGFCTLTKKLHEVQQQRKELRH